MRKKMYVITPIKGPDTYYKTVGEIVKSPTSPLFGRKEWSVRQAIARAKGIYPIVFAACQIDRKEFDICRIISCGGVMLNCKAAKNTLSSSDEGTCSYSSDAALVDVLRCVNCGYFITKPSEGTKEIIK